MIMRKCRAVNLIAWVIDRILDARTVVKKIIVLLAFLGCCSMNVDADGNEDLVMAMLYIVSPSDEDPSSIQAATSVCECVLNQAKSFWSESEFDVFSKEVIAYSLAVDSALADPADFGLGALPQRSESLNQRLKKLLPYISDCEQKFDTEVEF